MDVEDNDDHLREVSNINNESFEFSSQEFSQHEALQDNDDQDAGNDTSGLNTQEFLELLGDVDSEMSQDSRENSEKVPQDSQEDSEKVPQDGQEDSEKVSQDGQDDSGKVAQDNQEDPEKMSQDSPEESDSVKANGVLENNNSEEAEEFDDDEEEDDEDEEKLTLFPASRIKSIMNMNPKTKMCGADVVFLITKATELFVQKFGEECIAQTTACNRKTVVEKDVKSAIASNDAFQFMDGVLETFSEQDDEP